MQTADAAQRAFPTVVCPGATDRLFLHATAMEIHVQAAQPSYSSGTGLFSEMLESFHSMIQKVTTLFNLTAICLFLSF